MTRGAHRAHLCGAPPVGNSRCQTAQLRSRGAGGARVLTSFAAPNEGRRSAERRQLCRADQARRAPGPGALAFRRSTSAIFGPGTRASPSGIGAGGCSENSSQLGRSTQPSFPRTSRGCGCEPRPQDAKPRSAFRNASRTRPLTSETARPITRTFCSQETNSLCVRKTGTTQVHSRNVVATKAATW